MLIFRAWATRAIQCVGILQTGKSKKTGGPNFKILQYIHVMSHKASKTLDQTYDGRTRSEAKDVFSSLYVSQTLRGTKEIKNMQPNRTAEILLYVACHKR